MSTTDDKIRGRLSRKIREGDRVAYARGFLQSIGDYTNHDRGVVVSLGGEFCQGNPESRVAMVEWDSDHASRVLIWNLVRVEDLQFEAR